MQKMLFQKLMFIICLSLLTSLAIQAQEPTLYISEFMSANGSFISDEQGENDDWIEIYNYGNEAIDLEGLFFSDDENTEKVQIKESLVIDAKSYLQRAIWDWAINPHF